MRGVGELGHECDVQYRKRALLQQFVIMSSTVSVKPIDRSKLLSWNFRLASDMFPTISALAEIDKNLSSQSKLKIEAKLQPNKRWGQT
ncbi:hypothetical protein [Sinorhizobium meliloti]|uniref:hypothetical protein n=1 Tax=Rhizobium meliloti TaxID=382 RepID=UPI00037A5FAC|nr:hypothetical protein [Sinorhizobium meliloti]